MIKSYHIDPNTSTNQFLIRSESIPSSIFTSQHQRNTICDNTSHSESFRIMDTQNKQSQSQLLPSLSMPRFNINDNNNSIKSDNEQNKHSDDKDTYIMTNKTEESEDNDSQNHHNNNNVGYINVDQVQSPPGPDFIEWKRITKQLLKTIEEFEIKNGFENVSNIPFEIGHYQTETILHLNDKIDHWRGVQLTRLKGKTMDNFKSYFVIGKNWIDQNKKIVWAPYFWIKIFNQIKNFTMKMGKKHFKNKCALLQNEYGHCLELEIINNIFEGTVQFAQTKSQPLIPNGTLKLSKEIQTYLLSLDGTLTVNAWCEVQKKKQKAKDAKENKKRKRTGNAKELVKRLKDELSTLLNISHNKLNNVDSHQYYCAGAENDENNETEESQILQIQKQAQPPPLPPFPIPSPTPMHIIDNNDNNNTVIKYDTERVNEPTVTINNNNNDNMHRMECEDHKFVNVNNIKLKNSISIGANEPQSYNTTTLNNSYNDINDVTMINSYKYKTITNPFINNHNFNNQQFGNSNTSNISNKSNITNVNMTPIEMEIETRSWDTIHSNHIQHEEGDNSYESYKTYKCSYSPVHSSSNNVSSNRYSPISTSNPSLLQQPSFNNFNSNNSVLSTTNSINSVNSNYSNNSYDSPQHTQYTPIEYNEDNRNNSLNHCHCDCCDINTNNNVQQMQPMVGYTAHQQYPQNNVNSQSQFPRVPNLPFPF